MQHINNRYQLESILGSGGMGMVFKAMDRLTNEHVALKSVQDAKMALPDSSPSLLSFRDALTREFNVLARLRHPYIISVLDFGFDDENHPYFTMDYLDAPQTIVAAARAVPLQQKLTLVLQLLEAIRYLHHRQILHRDLKPENIVVAEGRVQVLDFGLSVLRKYQQQQDGDTVSGTLAYMAPEVLQGYGASPASDIYAVGLILFEMLVGAYPFDRANPTRLIRAILYNAPDLSLVEAADLPLAYEGPLTELIARTLLKDPNDRYQDVGEMLAVLNDLLGQPPRDESRVRESFLQSARLVGRDHELAQLVAALDALQNAHGALWLVGGISGIGKSRLLDELRIKALVRGVLVLRGQAVAEGGYPYQLWRDILRRLLLENAPSSSEAAVLKPIVRDIEALLGEQVPDAPDIGAVASHRRLLNVITNQLMRYDRPLVILLEDLHWSPESTELLKQIERELRDRPILIIASYRNNEAPTLHTEFDNPQVLALEPISTEHVSELSESIVGEYGRNPELLRILQNEAQGNLMFIIEIIRALAIEMGQIEDIGTVTLPADIFRGGITRVIQHRVNSLDAATREILTMAAVLGKSIDLAALQHQFGQRAVEAWLQVCSEAVLVVIQDETWFFAHDSIRETVLGALSPAERADEYRRAAEAVMAVHEEDDVLARLAYYWRQANQPEQEAQYTRLAGVQAYNNGAFADAAANFERLMVLYESGIAHQSVDAARSRRMLGTAYFELGDQQQAMDTLLAAVDDVSYRIPTRQPQLGFGLLGEVTRQLVHRVRRRSLNRGQEERREANLEVALAFNQIAEVALAYGDAGLLGLYASLRGLNTAERVGPSVPLAYSYGGMAWFTAAAGLKRVANLFLQLAEETLEQAKEPRAVTVGNFPIAITYTGWGEWSQARAKAQSVIDTADSIGDWRSWRQSVGLLGDINYYTGYYDACIENYETCYESTRRVGDTGQLALQAAILGRNYLMVGRWEDALAAAREADAAENPSSMATFNTAMVLLQHSIQRGDTDETRRQALAFLGQAKANPLKIFVHFDGYAALAETWVGLFAQDPSAENGRYAEESLKLLSGFARTYPIGRARRYALEGYYQHLRAQPDKALTLVDQGLETARQLQMPFDEGLALLYRSRITGQAADQQQAMQVFERIGSAWGLRYS